MRGNNLRSARPANSMDQDSFDSYDDMEDMLVMSANRYAQKSMMNIIGPAMKTIPTMPPIPLCEFKLCILVHPNPLQRVSRLWNSHVSRRVLLESMGQFSWQVPNTLLNLLGIHYRSDSWRSQAQKRKVNYLSWPSDSRGKKLYFFTCALKWFSIQVSNEKLKRNKHSKSWQ